MYPSLMEPDPPHRPVRCFSRSAPCSRCRI